jgi:hypothetical protein
VSRNGLTFEDLETFLLRKLAARADFFFSLCKFLSVAKWYQMTPKRGVPFPACKLGWWSKLYIPSTIKTQTNL